MNSKKLSFSEFSALYSSSQGFVWEDSQTSPFKSQITYLYEPRTVYQMYADDSDPSQLKVKWEEIWKETEALAKSGEFLSGFLSYELGFLSSEALYPYLPKSDFPLLSITSYRIREELLVNHPRLDELQPTAITMKKPALSETQFEEQFQKIQKELLDGNSYQLNFTFPWEMEGYGNPFDYYQFLKLKQKTRYSSFFSFQNRNGKNSYVLSLSPELFWNRSGQKIIVQPMKGTSPRGKTTSEDRALEQTLEKSEKERAENLMIVDLLRNDLGRVAKPGSVKVLSLFKTEKLETVWQMTSQIEAELQDKSFFNALYSLFPSGSVTGAPKISSMKILSELEKSLRGIYTGAIFHLSEENGIPTSTANVTIRTLVLENEETFRFTGKYFTGSGITVLSDAKAEYEECLQKASFLEISENESFRLLETMIFYPSGIRFWKEHQARMESAASQLGFPFSRLAIENSLKEKQKQWSSPQIIRLLLAKNGDLEWQAKPIQRERPRASRKIKLLKVNIDLDSLTFRFKTDQRAFYSSLLQYAKQVCVDDILLCNKDNQVIETCLKNIFFKQGSSWFTPSLKSEGIRGVLRERLIKKGWVSEKDINADELMQSDKVLLGNSVRGFEYIVWEIQK